MLEPGLEATIEERVTEAMTARALGSGDVPVLGTPAVLALAERAACAAIDGKLDPGQTSVGATVELSHLAPTAVGSHVTAQARLTAVDGRKLRFALTVSDGSGEVARGTHERVVVDRERFLSAAIDR
ncbi:MAG: thioesterase family protein [Actinomycetota bacterium]